MTCLESSSFICLMLIRNTLYFDWAFLVCCKTFFFNFSWNVGPVHIISFSTELYYFLEYGIEPLVQQHKWLQKDLEVLTVFY